VSEGRVSISWQYEAAESGRLRIVWKEYGGPEVEPPQHRGFGSSLVERLLSAELRGQAKVSFERSGVICVIEADLAKISADATS
jgi:two-component sensor histidine kinase